MISRRQIIAGLERHGESAEQLSRVGQAYEDGLGAAIAQVIQELTPEQKAEVAARIRQEFLNSGLPAEGLNIIIGKSEKEGQATTKYEGESSMPEDKSGTNPLGETLTKYRVQFRRYLAGVLSSKEILEVGTPSDALKATGFKATYGFPHAGGRYNPGGPGSQIPLYLLKRGD